MTSKKSQQNVASSSTSADVSPAGEASAPVVRTKGQRLLLAVDAPLSTIAAACGVKSKQTIADWKAGRKVPTPETRTRIEKAYGIPAAAWTQVPGTTGTSTQVLSGTTGANTMGTTSADPNSLAEVEDLLRVVRSLRDDTSITASEKLKVVAEERALLAQRERILERQELLEDRLVREHPAWARTRDLILATLTKHPEAAKDVARVLGVVSP